MPGLDRWNEVSDNTLVLHGAGARKASTFLQNGDPAALGPRAMRVRSEGFAAWFPNAEETRVRPPEGQEAMEIQEAEKEEETAEDPLSQALQDAGDSAASSASNQLHDLKDKASHSLEAGKDEGAGKAVADALKDEDTGDPPDVDHEHDEPKPSLMENLWYYRMYFLSIPALAVALSIIGTALAPKGRPDPKEERDELEETYGHDPRAPVAKGSGKGAQEEEDE
ncbi:unnamed protein product [Durusdinium trenchii]|uniref:Uncharacterized protein n=1 Tax=Durusdinium trenchii TaxID=1381693 RepID=A0ABP0LRB9_9DINO